MMRLALFEISERSCAVALDKVLHVLTAPHVFRLPLLRSCFAGGLVYQSQVVPLLTCGYSDSGGDRINLQPDFVLVCEAEFGLLGVPAERMLGITKAGEVDAENCPDCASQAQMYAINGRDFRLLELNQVLEDPAFTMTG